VRVRISPAGSEAIITGDALHHPVQLAAPTWQIQLGHDGAVATRLVFVDRYAESGIRVFGSHFLGGPRATAAASAVRSA